MKAIDLFAGFGGFTLGATQAGARVVWAANHWPLAVETHARNHAGTEHVCQDLRQADWTALPRFDLLLASPACQGHSQAAQPKRRLDLRHIATHPRRATLRCTYDDLTVDHELNQLLAAGLRLAAAVMESRDLRLDLARSADRFFGDLERRPLSTDWLEAMLSGLDRRSSHYRTALTLIALIHHGARLGEHVEPGTMPLSSFTLNMNMVFERFLGRYLSEHCPEDVRIGMQDVRSDVFSYLENGGGWNQPTIRPDFVLRRFKQVVAVADAKYKNRHENPPSSAELYQLTTYGLAYAMPEPREVLLLHPLARGEFERATTLLFAPSAAGQQVRIRLVGVPVDDLLDGSIQRWWPLPLAPVAVAPRSVSGTVQIGAR